MVREKVTTSAMGGGKKNRIRGSGKRAMYNSGGLSSLRTSN